MDPNQLHAIDSHAVGELGVMHLRRWWARNQLLLMGEVNMEEARREWKLDNILSDGLGLGLGQIFSFLYQPGVDFAEMEARVVECAGQPSAEQVAEINAALRAEMGEAPPPALETLIARDDPVLSEEDLAHFEEHGYVVIPDAVPPEQYQAAAAAVYEAVGASPDDPESWYRLNERRKLIMVELYQHPALAANRGSYRIHRAFAQLWGSEALRCSFDKVSFSAPEREDYPFQGPHIHWDVEFDRVPLPFGLQGLLYLTDTAANQGAFACVPGFHHRFDEWYAQLPPEADPNKQDFEAWGLKPIAGRAGDFILWHHALPHGPTPNSHHLPRLVQYIKLYPVGGE